MCHTQDNYRQFYNKKDCDAICKDMGENMKCVCDYKCYICIPEKLEKDGTYGKKCCIVTDPTNEGTKKYGKKGCDIADQLTYPQCS